MMKWEYNIYIQHMSMNHLGTLDDLGKIGWELVSCTQHTASHYQFVFKRPIIKDEEEDQ